MLAGVMIGANFIFQAAGWLEGGLTMGYEEFVVNADHYGTSQKYLGGLQINESLLATEAFQEIIPGRRIS